MKLECVIVCKDYSDFLAETLPYNLEYFDDIVVVTSPDDVATQGVCAKNSVECVKTSVFTENGEFNKGMAINLGLNHLKGEDWVLHLDADIILPHRFRHLLDRAQLKPKNIYGADRVNVYGFEAWKALEKHLSSMVHPYEQRWFLDPGFCHKDEVPNGIRYGARVIHMEYGWVPIGFFQLWHGSHGARYNYKRGQAAGTDVMFPTLWPRENRVLLPEVVCYHLDSELKHGIGTNWKGRKSRPFAPEKKSPEVTPKPMGLEIGNGTVSNSLPCGCLKFHLPNTPGKEKPCECQCHHHHHHHHPYCEEKK